MTVDEIRNFVNFIAKKNQNGANPKPTEFNLALQRSYMEWVTRKCKEWQANQKNTDDIKFLLVERLIQVPATGLMQIPNGTTNDVSGALCPEYMHLSALRSLYVKPGNGAYKQMENKVDVVRDSEVSAILNSQIRYPNKEYPIANFIGNNIQFYPKDLGFVRISYLRKPTMPSWEHKLNANGNPVYDSAASIQLESPEDTHNDITMSILRFLGISIRDLPLSQYAQSMKEEGI